MLMERVHGWCRERVARLSRGLWLVDRRWHHHMLRITRLCHGLMLVGRRWQHHGLRMVAILPHGRLAQVSKDARDRISEHLELHVNLTGPSSRFIQRTRGHREAGSSCIQRTRGRREAGSSCRRGRIRRRVRGRGIFPVRRCTKRQET